MLTVKTLQETNALILEKFGSHRTQKEQVLLFKSLGRLMAEDIISREFIPNFNRSTVDGFAVKAADIQGSSDSIPAILTCIGETYMGQSTDLVVTHDHCVVVPTGGEVPQGADTVVMLEYVERIDEKQLTLLRKPCGW